ncbi:hypothetical protein [Neobacillus mesonae]|uniref:hypothetical protein n=1 Tax=Neobacillus mesonae TaxID=1193713 RepID=UPI00203A759C|nr:hypothetical protein [Neobacillus mesonae]MCM3570025.1 hypothetical protein [Neobacillus mesonae]
MRIVICLSVLLFSLVNVHVDAREKMNQALEKSGNLRHIMVSGTQGHYLVKGEVKRTKEKWYYTVEDGHKEYVKEKQVQIRKSQEKWIPFQFEVTLPRGKLPHNASLLIYLYQKGNEGKKNIFPFVLERLE